MEEICSECSFDESTTPPRAVVGALKTQEDGIADRQEAPWAGTVDIRMIPGSLEQVALSVDRAGTQALPVAMDLLDRKAVGAAADFTLDTFGRVDLVWRVVNSFTFGCLRKLMDVYGRSLAAARW